MRYTVSDFGSEVFTSDNLDEALAEAYSYADCRRGDGCLVDVNVQDEEGNSYDWE